MKEQRLKIIFIALFALLGFGAMQVPFSNLIGATNVKFTLFDFYGPIAGGFIGSTFGAVAVALMQLVNSAVKGFAMDMATFIRMIPMIFAVLYFSKNSKWILGVPLVAMIVFWTHPEGRA